MRYIDQDKIYSATDSGLKIFEHYFPNVDLKASKTFFKEREDEKLHRLMFPGMITSGE